MLEAVLDLGALPASRGGLLKGGCALFRGQRRKSHACHLGVELSDTDREEPSSPAPAEQRATRCAVCSRRRLAAMAARVSENRRKVWSALDRTRTFPTCRPHFEPSGCPRRGIPLRQPRRRVLVGPLRPRRAGAASGPCRRTPRLTLGTTLRSAAPKTAGGPRRRALGPDARRQQRSVDGQIGQRVCRRASRRRPPRRAERLRAGVLGGPVVEHGRRRSGRRPARPAAPRRPPGWRSARARTPRAGGRGQLEHRPQRPEPEYGETVTASAHSGEAGRRKASA